MQCPRPLRRGRETRGLFSRVQLAAYEVSGWDPEEAAGSGSWGSRRVGLAAGGVPACVGSVRAEVGGLPISHATELGGTVVLK